MGIGILLHSVNTESPAISGSILMNDFHLLNYGNVENECGVLSFVFLLSLLMKIDVNDEWSVAKKEMQFFVDFVLYCRKQDVGISIPNMYLFGSYTCGQKMTNKLF